LKNKALGACPHHLDKENGPWLSKKSAMPHKWRGATAASIKHYICICNLYCTNVWIRAAFLSIRWHSESSSKRIAASSRFFLPSLVQPSRSLYTSAHNRAYTWSDLFYQCWAVIKKQEQIPGGYQGQFLKNQITSSDI